MVGSESLLFYVFAQPTNGLGDWPGRRAAVDGLIKKSVDILSMEEKYGGRDNLIFMNRINHFFSFFPV